MVKDPVCGMEVDEASGEYKVEREGRTYYFCTPTCKSTFLQSPEKYLRGKRIAMEEIERRILFTWFLTIIGFVVVGIAAHLISSSFGLPMWFHGLTGACIGLIFFHLYLFDAFWEDRYLVMSIGILLAVGFILWGVFASAMPELIAGVISLVTALLVIGTAAWFNMVGWKTEDVERKYRYVHFIGLIAGIVILLVVVAAISV